MSDPEAHADAAAEPSSQPAPGERKPRIPLAPRTRKLVAFAVLAAGALVVGQTLFPVAPREVEVRVRLAPFRSPPAVARAITVELSRDGAPVRSVSERFTAGPPVEWRRTLTLPPGGYQATVNVELDGRTAVRDTPVRVTASGEPLDLPAPPAE